MNNLPGGMIKPDPRTVNLPGTFLEDPGSLVDDESPATPSVTHTILIFGCPLHVQLGSCRHGAQGNCPTHLPHPTCVPPCHH